MFANMNEWLPVAILLVPLFTALTIFLIPENKESFRTSVNLLSAALNIGLIVVLINGVYQGQVFEACMPLLPDINLVFHADALSLMFVTLSGVLWLFTTLYAIGYFAHGKQRSRFFGFFSLCVFSTIGIALAGNLITFLIFYELLTLATYPLIMHKGNDASLRSGKIYLAYTMIGGAVLLIGVVWLKSFAGSLEFSNTYDLMALAEGDTQLLTIILVMLLLGLGVKAAIFPLHGWLPRAMAAPAPVSSLLHAVAVVKAGAFGIIRVVYDVYGIDLVAKLNMLNVLLVFAAFTILYGSVRAVFQSDIKKRLAYSTVSQVSYIALGIAVAGPFAALGAIVHLVHQGLMKITMFFCAGNLAESHHIYRVDQLNGIGKKMPYTMSAFTIAIFGMIGMPPIAGFVSKWYLGLGGLQSDLIWVQGVLIGSSILNAMYFLPIVYRAWFLPASDSKQGANLEESEHSSQSDGAYHIQIKEAPWSMLLPPIVTVSIAIMAGLFASSAYSPLAWAKHITSSRGLELSEIASYNAVHTANHGNFWMLLVVICLPVLMLAVARVVKLPKLLSLSLPVIALTVTILSFIVPSNELFVSGMFFGASFALDEVSRPFLQLAGILWCLASLAALFYRHFGQQRANFSAAFAICMSASFALVLASDFFGFITFFTIMSLASYVLIILNHTVQSHLAANYYIRWVIAGEVALFLAFTGLFWAATNNEQLASHPLVVLGFIVGFGIKLGLFGLHLWLPLAHPVAALPGSAMLSGFMVKAGLIGLLKFFPMDQGAQWGGAVFAVLGCIGAIAAVLLGIRKTNPKAILAYSTVSQMGIVSALFGALVMLEDIRAGLLVVLILYCLHHGLAKCMLFLSAGLYSNFGRGGMLRWGTWLAVLLPALSLVGFPLLSGYYAKGEAKLLLSNWPLVKYGFVISSIFTALLMLRYIHCLYQQGATKKAQQGTPEIGLLIISLAGCAIMLVMPWLKAEYITGSVLSVGDAALSIGTVVIAYLVYRAVQAYLPQQEPSIEPTQGLVERLYVACNEWGALVQAKSAAIFEQKIRPLLNEHTSPNESTGETMQSQYVSALIMALCAMLVLALLL